MNINKLIYRIFNNKFAYKMGLNLILNPTVRDNKIIDYLIEKDMEIFKCKNCLINIQNSKVKMCELNQLRQTYYIHYKNVENTPEILMYYRKKISELINILNNEYNVIYNAEQKEHINYQNCINRMHILDEKIKTLQDFQK